jgi:hypothetical protein
VRLRSDVVVLLDEEGGAVLDFILGREVVEKEASVLERHPEALDHRIGRADVRAREDALQDAAEHVVVDGLIEVFATLVADELGRRLGVAEELFGFAQKEAQATARYAPPCSRVTRQARMKREKLSMMAWMHRSVPSARRTKVSSMCQTSFGREARMPSFCGK